VHVDFTGRGYATACARALTQAGLALCDVVRVEIHTDEANAISAAVPRRLGYRLDRVDEVGPPGLTHTPGGSRSGSWNPQGAAKL
jgi:RimJ/RimL family protein N-acetyltransferase